MWATSGDVHVAIIRTRVFYVFALRIFFIYHVLALVFTMLSYERFCLVKSHAFTLSLLKNGKDFGPVALREFAPNDFGMGLGFRSANA